MQSLVFTQDITGLQQFRTKADKYSAKDLKIQNHPAFTSFSGIQIFKPIIPHRGFTEGTIERLFENILGHIHPIHTSRIISPVNIWFTQEARTI